MANMITLSRVLLLFLLVTLAYMNDLYVQIIALFLLIAIFIMDALDGWVARLRDESSLFGSVFDIAADRIVENVLWVVLAHLGRVPLWVALVFLVRGFLVDSIRTVGASGGQTPFGMMATDLGHFLVASRFMRMSYGVSKTLAFAWLFLLPIIANGVPALWSASHRSLESIGSLLVLTAVVLCIVRGLPVVIEFAQRQGVLATRQEVGP